MRPAATAAIIRPARPAAAAGQAAWIAAMEPWRGLGYGAGALGKFLRRAAAAGHVWVAVAGPRAVAQGVLVLQPNVLLGRFVALLAVRPAAARRGIGRALMSRAEAETFAARRWLFVSCDATNRAALSFYRRLGFVRVGRLTDLVQDGRVEILLRKGRPGPGSVVSARRRPASRTPRRAS